MVNDYDPVLEAVHESQDPVIRYRAERDIQGTKPASAAMQRLREQIADSPVATGLLADLEASDPDDRAGLSTIYLTLRYLADVNYPPGDTSLVPYRDHVYAWLRRLEEQYDGPLHIRGTHRCHASFHGNAIYSSIALGIDDDQTDELAENLLRYQWPAGGWNCNKKPATKGPTIVHTAFGLQGLATYQTRRNTKAVEQAVEDAAEVMLERQVYLKRSNGKPLRPVYVKPSYPYPRLYDFMAGLHILMRSGHITDPRCAAALDLLESKLIDGQGWAMERKLFSHTAGKEDYTRAPWGEARSGKASLHLTVDALAILKAAGRL